MNNYFIFDSERSFISNGMSYIHVYMYYGRKKDLNSLLQTLVLSNLTDT